MKKGLIAVAVLAAGGLAAMPYVTGKIAESETRAMLANINEKPEQYGTTNIVTYDRGYASSTVRYDYELPAGLALMTGGESSVLIDCDYKHGIVGIDYDCNLRANEAYQQFVTDEFNGEDPLTITGAISATGGWSQDVAVKAIDTQTENGAFKLEPSSLKIQTNKDFSVIDGKTDIGAVAFSNEEGAMTLSPSDLVFKFKPTDVGLYEGDYKMAVGDMDFIGPERKLTMRGFEMSGDAIERGEIMDYTMDINVASLKAEAEQDFMVENVSIKSETLGINSQAMADYQEIAAQLQADMLAGMEAGNTEDAVDPNQMLALLPVIERMLDKDLNIKLVASGDVMGKANSLDVQMGLLKKTSFTELSAFMFNPESVLGNIDVNLAASLNQELIQSNPAAGAMIGNSPFFKSEGENFVTKIKVGEKSAVNGKEVSFQELMGMAMAGMQPPAAPQTDVYEIEPSDMEMMSEEDSVE